MKDYLFPAKTKTSREFFLGLDYKDSIICSVVAIPIVYILYTILTKIRIYPNFLLYILGTIGLILAFVLFNMITLFQNDRRLYMEKKRRWKFNRKQYHRRKEEV